MGAYFLPVWQKILAAYGTLVNHFAARRLYRESARPPLSLYISCVMERGYNKLVSRLRQTKIHALFCRSGHGALTGLNFQKAKFF
jgi:UDP-glucose 4-epimerase